MIEGKDLSNGTSGTAVHCCGNVSISGKPNLIGAGEGVLWITEPATFHCWDVFVSHAEVAIFEYVFRLGARYTMEV